MVCFIILHYMVIEETITCINSLKKIKGEKKIIIVDNNSTNGSGLDLKRRYCDDSEIDVILNSDNLGFAQGNNIGCEYAKNRYNPIYYVVMNNDVEIIQNDFINLIDKIWQREKFDVLSPDIYSTTNKIHQSPKSLENMTIERARIIKRQYQKKLNSKIIVPLRCYLKQIDIINHFYKIKKIKKLKIDYSQKYYNVPLHGSCLIFHKSFVKKRREVFFPKTFFYFESEILDYECQKYGFKEVYDPLIKVYHHQNVSTNATFNTVLKKVRFMNQQNYNSISAFLNDFDK